MTPSLKPKKVDFEEKWQAILQTVENVINCRMVERDTWSTIENSEQELLSVYSDYWLNYSRAVTYINGLFSYLNQQYVKKYCPVPASDYLDVKKCEIQDLGMMVWYHEILSKIHDRLFNVIIDAYQTVRNGGNVNDHALKNCVQSIQDLSNYINKNSDTDDRTYANKLQDRLEDETDRYFKVEASRLLSTLNCAEYAKVVNSRVAEEKFRATKFLDAPIAHAVISRVENCLVTSQIDCLKGDFKEMAHSENDDHLKILYTFLIPSRQGLTQLSKDIQDYITIKALTVRDDVPAESCVSFVHDLLKVYRQYEERIQSVFDNNEIFRNALNGAFETVLNWKNSTDSKQLKSSNNRSAEYLAKYCDVLLKKSTSKKMSLNENEIEEKLMDTIILFRHIDDKDIFQRIYAKMLSCRLIYSLSVSNDLEERMVSLLKETCGYEFTSKFYKMLQDLKVTDQLKDDYNSYLEREQCSSKVVTFSFNVLQACAWPLSLSNLPSFSLPSCLEHSIQSFESFYKVRFNGRKLTWLFPFCTAEVKLNYTIRPYQVTMSVFQMASLLAFQEVNCATIKEIRSLTNLPESDTVKNLQALIQSEILIKIDENSYKLNLAFTSKRTKFKVISSGFSSLKEAKQEIEKSKIAVQEDRKMLIQAAIVRIMKSRRLLKHTLLMDEVIDQCKARFTPLISVIKKCIETLIDKGYLKRDELSVDSYTYIA
ncbi:DgyrCDS7343 [Dimorphilus gyrociliatus]|uniref:DgyrCDS7343 n=1 Tax=Dimorphilus gyrociliatus TaxID=2664684 RepID=A0A7I8VQS8_9ANNE|nr:DgyrCDS7343 [Dimorphilus gyrociliatus]